MALSQLRRFVSPDVERLVPGSYLTDGHRLLRVVSRFEADHASKSASLEDCLTLEVRCYSPGELYAMRLRRVDASTAG